MKRLLSLIALAAFGFTPVHADDPQKPAPEIKPEVFEVERVETKTDVKVFGFTQDENGKIVPLKGAELAGELPALPALPEGFDLQALMAQALQNADGQAGAAKVEVKGFMIGPDGKKVEFNGDALPKNLEGVLGEGLPKDLEANIGNIIGEALKLAPPAKPAKPFVP